MGRRFFLYQIFIYLIVLLPYSHITGQVTEKIDSLQKQDIEDKIDDLRRQGNKYYNEGNFDAAIQKYDSIFLYNPNSIIARNNLGVVYKRLGRYNDALRVYFEAESIVRLRANVNMDTLARVYNNIGNIYNLKKDYDLALQYLNFAERIWKDAGIMSYPANTVYNNIGNSYYGMEEWRKALRSYQEGIETKLSIDDSRGLDAIYANCATIYEELKELDSASMYYNLSIQAKKYSYGEESFQLIPTYTNFGGLLLRMGKRDLAYDYLALALVLADSSYESKHPDVADIYLELAKWYLEGGEIGKSLEYYQQGIVSVVFDFNSYDVFDNPELDNEIISEPVLLQLLIEKARALNMLFMESGEQRALHSSMETFELANNLVEKMRSSYLSEGSKLLITGFARTGFDHTIQTAYDLYMLSGDENYANKAFIYAEKSKSSVLLASLQEVERKKDLAIPADIRDMEQSLKEETDEYKKWLYEESQRPAPDQIKIGKWEEKLFYLSQQLDSINGVIRERFPEYAAKYNNEVVDLYSVMSTLAKDEVVLEYSMSDTWLYIFMVSREKFRIERLSIDADFHNDVAVLSRFLRNNDFARNTYEDYKAYCDAAYNLYSVFLKPVEKEIEEKELLIIPDGDLGYIPFEALLTEEAPDGGMDYRSLPYLLYKYRTNYSYSATLYFSEHAGRRKAEKTLIAFAPTYENIGEINSQKFPIYRDYSTYLVPLRFISTEIRNISEIIDADKFEAYEATEKAFKENAPDYNILHLAMHTLLNDENPLYSKLVFTLNNDTLEENDGLLHAYEIFNMQLNARMAVLSACNTGYGKLQKGEGVMSMARGFIFAGVPSIIMTLWAVEDQSGSMLMSKFYSNLVEGMEIDQALQEAKLQYLKEADQLRAHPYLWSGYVSIGSTDALIRSSWSSLIFISGAAIILIIAAIFIILRLRSRRRA